MDSEEDQHDVTIKKKDEVNEYIDLLNKGKMSSLDTVYGVCKMHDDTYKIGDTRIYFEDNNITIDLKKYEQNPGLIELLFMKQPNDKLITVKDLKNYEEILNNTNACK